MKLPNLAIIIEQSYIVLCKDKMHATYIVHINALFKVAARKSNFNALLASTSVDKISDYLKVLMAICSLHITRFLLILLTPHLRLLSAAIYYNCMRSAMFKGVFSKTKRTYVNATCRHYYDYIQDGSCTNLLQKYILRFLWLRIMFLAVHIVNLSKIL